MGGVRDYFRGDVPGPAPGDTTIDAAPAPHVVQTVSRGVARTCVGAGRRRARVRRLRRSVRRVHSEARELLYPIRMMRRENQVLLVNEHVALCIPRLV
jgi:hypothetical protein